MKTDGSISTLTPWKAVATVMFALIASELVIMVVLNNPFASGELDEQMLKITLLDAISLGVIMSPIVYYFLLIPLQNKTIVEQERIHALHDGLSGLPTRKLFVELVRHEITMARRDHSTLALIIIDPGRLSEINQVFGYSFGDFVIREIGDRLKRLFRESDIKARIGGDEFGILLPSMDDQNIDTIKNHIKDTLGEPFHIGNISVDIGVTMGVSMFPAHATDEQMLMQRARIALSKAKSELQESAIFDKELESDIQDRINLYGEIRHAIEKGDFELYYQPKIDLKSMRLAGAEALVRWSVGGSPRAPANFIPFAEQVGLIGEITKWVAIDAIRQISFWQAAGLTVPVSINLSARDLLNPNLSEQLANLCGEHNVSPTLVTLEVTESAVMSQPDCCISVLQQARDHGFKVSIDDFGTGHSSLVYLRDIPADELKVDQSFVKTLGQDPHNDDLVSTIAGLGKKFGLSIVAEGVENEVLLQHVIADGCEIAQGYLFSRPQPANEFVQWCNAWNEKLTATE